jgi:hypothetical protein
MHWDKGLAPLIALWGARERRKKRFPPPMWRSVAESGLPTQQLTAERALGVCKHQCVALLRAASAAMEHGARLHSGGRLGAGR